MPLITVILSVYNIKGEYLTKAVGSVLAQSFDDFELLIVDDGSRRETAAVCDELAAEDKRITVFHNVNQGPGKSRNFGLSKAQGAFVIFMDHDDWVEKDWLKKLYESISITGSSSQNTDMYFDVFKTIESAAAKCAADGISVKRIIDRNMNFFCSANDIIKSRKEFIGKMRSYIKKFGLKDVLRKQRNRKIRHWLFTADKKNGVLRVLGIYLMNGRKKS